MKKYLFYNKHHLVRFIWLLQNIKIDENLKIINMTFLNPSFWIASNLLKIAQNTLTSWFIGVATLSYLFNVIVFPSSSLDSVSIYTKIKKIPVETLFNIWKLGEMCNANCDMDVSNERLVNNAIHSFHQFGVV